MIRRLGEWMALAGATLMLVNAVRAVVDPAAFAAYLGTPLSSPEDAPLVFVYALRALFIGLTVIGLVIARQRLALAIVAGVAVVMPVGDAFVTAQAGAASAIVIRHVVIALFLALTASALALPLRKHA